MLTDTLPPGISNPVTSLTARDVIGVPAVTLGTIAGDASAQYTITVDVVEGTSGTITNTAVVNSITFDTNSNKNAAGQGTTIKREIEGLYGRLGGRMVSGQVMRVNKSVIVTRLILLPVRLMTGMVVHQIY